MIARSIAILLALTAHAAADPCDKPSPRCECSKGSVSSCYELIHGNKGDFYMNLDANCASGDTLSCYFEGLMYDETDHARAAAPLQKACDAGFADACVRLGRFLDACVLGDDAGCDQLDGVLLTVDEQRLIAGACAKFDGDSCVLLAPPLEKVSALCLKNHPLACSRIAPTLESRRPDRALMLYGRACASIPTACVSMARMYIRTDEKRAIDLLTPLCEKKVPGACFTLDEASHQK